MPRLSNDELARLGELKALLGTFVEGAPPVLRELLVPLKELLGAERMVAYGLDAVDGSVGVSFLHATGAETLIRKVVEREYAGSVVPGAFNGARPEPVQRNRSLTLPQLFRLSPRYRDNRLRRVAFPEVGMGGWDQLRVLVCEGDSLLSWVGGFRSEPFTWREQRMLAELTPALRKRLWLERQLDVSEFALAGLDEALALLPGAAFVVQTGGRIVHANPAGRQRLEKDAKATRERIAACLRRPKDEGPFQLIPLAARGAPDHALAIERAGAPQPGADPAILARRFGLTPRQTQVLALLLRGYANRSIAADLQCAVNTVEHHVSAVLAKAGVDSRAELLALASRSH